MASHQPSVKRRCTNGIPGPAELLRGTRGPCLEPSSDCECSCYGASLFTRPIKQTALGNTLVFQLGFLWLGGSVWFSWEGGCDGCVNIVVLQVRVTQRLGEVTPPPHPCRPGAARRSLHRPTLRLLLRPSRACSVQGH